MAEKTAPIKKLSDKSTKQEMLDAYQSLVKQLDEKRAAELNPERRLEEKKSEEAIKMAGTVAPEGIDREIGSLKSEISATLAEVAEKLAAEAVKFKNLQKAVESKVRELQELYGIEKSAASLAALIEAQNQKRQEFDAEMNRQREELTREINENREEWEKERKAHEAELRERDTAEKKARDREKEQFDYAFKRDAQALRDKLADEKATLEKELRLKKETAEKELTERERAISEKENELAVLRAKTAAFPKELDTTVDKAVKEATDKLKLEAKSREDLAKKESEGERNVFTTQIESLEKLVKDLAEQNAKFSRQTEAAYQKVQEIAEKTIESAGHAKSLADLQKLLVDQNRKTGGEK
ncbi:MAG: hypothetical protein NTW03_13835 [Verrucomicrobia bacterium]|nr:hypothetical protein [Verrucomicrobiota bacterium]